MRVDFIDKFEIFGIKYSASIPLIYKSLFICCMCLVMMQFYFRKAVNKRQSLVGDVIIYSIVQGVKSFAYLTVCWKGMKGLVCRLSLNRLKKENYHI